MSVPPADEPRTDPGQGPKRIRRPRLSGKVAAFWLVVGLALTALLIPAVLNLPRWVEYEIALGVWWAIWFAVLARVLYTGRLVADDYGRKRPGNWFTSPEPAPAGKRRRDGGSDWWDGLSLGPMDSDAFLGCLAIVLVVVVAVGLLWVVIEVAVPLVLFLLYVVARGMLAHVVNDSHGCRGRLGRAALWGFVWATAYTAPLAGVVWLIHYVQARG